MDKNRKPKKSVVVRKPIVRSKNKNTIDNACGSEIKNTPKENAIEPILVERQTVTSEDLTSSKPDDLLCEVIKHLIEYEDIKCKKNKIEKKLVDDDDNVILHYDSEDHYENIDTARPNKRRRVLRSRKLVNNESPLVAVVNDLRRASNSAFGFKEHINKFIVRKLIMKLDKNTQSVKFICPLCHEQCDDGNKFHKHWNKLHLVERTELKTNVTLLNESKIFENCEYCVQVMKGYDCITNHLSSHDFMYDLSESCIICSVLYDSLLNHVTKHKPYNCLCCSKQFPNKVDLDSHMIVHLHEINKNEDENKTKKCTICSKKFYSVFDNVLDHLIDHHNTLYNFVTSGDVLKVCGNTVASNIIKYLNNQNRKRVTNNQKLFVEYLCLFCALSFKDSKCFTHHLSNIHNEKQRCRLCERVFPTKKSYLAHTKRNFHIIPQKKNIFICPICKYRTNDVVELRNHIVKHYSDNEFNNFDCPICDKVNYTFFALRYHLKTFKHEMP